MKPKYLLITALILFVSCKSKTVDFNYSEFQKKGTETAILTQSVLLSNVGHAIQKGGPVYAIDFCNLNASVIVDSLSHAGNCKISRISEKNRNPENGIKTKTEQALIKLFENGNLKDTIIQENQRLVFYKPIFTSLPACLKCHGDINSEIEIPTFEKLKSLYPNDKATGCKINDFRGLWKIEFVLSN